ncbi:MAG: hypothetical protein H5U40_10280, partial [Polyangiaceae bacterium]|nr:hypothetical protein [Polyangiaceae bacterium]
MQTLVLYFRDEPLREFALADRPLEVGSDGYCDIVVNDPGLAGRALLVQESGGTVVAYDLAKAGRGAGPAPFPLNSSIAVGANHRLVRLQREPRARENARDGERGDEGHTERLGIGAGVSEPTYLVIGRGAEARRRQIGIKPVSVGTASDNDLVLADRSVS